MNFDQHFKLNPDWEREDYRTSGGATWKVERESAALAAALEEEPSKAEAAHRSTTAGGCRDPRDAAGDGVPGLPEDS